MNTSFKIIKNVALISPKRSIWSKNQDVAEMFARNKNFLRPWFAPSLSILTIAGATPKEINVEIIDEDFECIDYNKKYDLIGISAMTQQAIRAYEIAEKFREKNIYVVMGGIHATAIPEEALKYVDTVIIGEGEELWNKFLEDFENNRQKRIYQNPQNCKYELESSPMPRYDLLKQEFTTKNEHFFNMIPIQVTRGCPHDCSFCLVSKIYGKKVRKKTISQVLKELKFIKSNFENGLIVFADDNLFLDRKYVKQLLEEIIPLKIKWFGQTDIRIAEDEEILKLAYKSGCQTLLIGFESLNISNLQNINSSHWKMKQLKKYNEGVNIIQSNGIVVYAAFIIGFENDTIETFKDIRDFMINNKCPGQFTVLTPLPGSELYEEYKSKSKLYENEYWDKCNFFDIVFKHNIMSDRQIQQGLIWLYEEVFNNQRNIERVIHMKNIYKRLPQRWSKI